MSWAQKGLVALEVAHTGYGAYESTKRIMAGCADWTDALSFLPLAGAFGRSARNASKLDNLDEIGDAAKATKNAALRNQGKAKNTLKSALSCSTSFVAGTEVLTPDGLVNIEDIEVGDWVISDDPNTPGEIEAKQVTRTFERTDNNGIYDVAIGDEVISSTGNHDFWILDEKLVSVDELQLGDWIIADNPNTPNVLEAKQVLKSTLNDDGSFELQLDDEIVTVTESEEFWIKDEKWVQAQDLEEGDLLQTEDGDFVAVDGIEVREGTFEVFNFEVEDFHTYFVSQDGVLVHNTNCEIPVYRGTNRYLEKQIFSDTGYILSDAAQKRFMENGGNVQEAIDYARKEHDKWLKIWGNENNFVQAHGEFGIELPREFGIDRTLISVTSDRNVVQTFGDTVFSGKFKESEIIKQTIPDAGESEYLIRFGTNRLNIK